MSVITGRSYAIPIIPIIGEEMKWYNRNNIKIRPQKYCLLCSPCDWLKSQGFYCALHSATSHIHNTLFLLLFITWP